ncbi:MAG TPA: MMPL family transporter [Acidimicrobiales bacterium]|nr:MMPL family transporter [Acidimicrobiales bacterium]
MTTTTTPPPPLAEATVPGATPPSWFGRVAGFVLRHRRAVMVAWLVLFLAGGMAAGKVSSRLKLEFSLPGQPGYETANRIVGVYGNGGETTPDIAVVSVPAGQTVSADQAQLAAAFDRVRAAVPGVRVVDLAVTHDPAQVTRDGLTTWALVLTPVAHSFSNSGTPKRVQAALSSALPAGYQVGTTSLDQLMSGGHDKGPGVLLETVIGGLGALAVLAFVFASLLALLPLLIAAVSIVSTLLVILGLTYLTDVSFIVQFLVSLIGLGVAIDYSLLLVTRWREERDKGLSNNDAIVMAASTAGRTVALSGLTVAIGLLALVVLPMPAMRSVGLGGMLIPLVSVSVVVTLLPALLGGIGQRMDWPHRRHENVASRPWTSWAGFIVRRRAFGVGAAAVILGLLITPVFGIRFGSDSLSSLAQKGPAHETLAALTAKGEPTGLLTPIEVLTTAAQAPAIQARLAGVPGITTVALPSGPTGTRDGLTELIAIPSVASLNNTSLGPVNAARDALAGQPGVIGMTGQGASFQDFSHAVYGRFPVMFGLIALLTVVLLTLAFRSIVLAVKAVVLNLLSLAATFGFMAWFWQSGHGSNALFSIPATGAITFWIPIMVFAFLFGLSMDYEVFILARVREEYDRTGDTTAAVVEGLGRTGRLVTSAALILFLAFASLASAPVTDIKVLATGLGVGILLDATVIRALLVPALVALLGRWNWWMPGQLGRWSARRLPVPAVPAPAPAGAP